MTKSAMKTLLAVTSLLLVGTFASADGAMNHKTKSGASKSDHGGSQSATIGSETAPGTMSGTTTSSKPAAKAQAMDMTPMKVKDVETLLDDVSKYSGKKVTVTGEVEDRIDSRSFVLESGGIFNDEIVVIGAKTLGKNQMALVRDDANITVTGTLHTVPVVDIRREISWDLDPQIEAELEGVRAFIVADQIVSQK